MRIQVLPQTLINQIAAGEVIVNMASVVKELVENSIDAGARHIIVEIGNDVRDLTITDDGIGMDRDDAELCLQRHATSKIRNQDDLFRLSTRGFRGEAMPSIASVSRMEIQTRPAADLHGTRVVVEGGAIERIESTGCPAGTRIVIRDLFYNTPARLKFLKSPVAEMNAIMKTVVRQALAAPVIGFRVVREGEALLELPAGQSIADRFLSIAGSRIDTGLIEVDYERDEVRVKGHIAQPLSTQGDRRSQYLFINGRPFSSKTLTSSIEQAFRGFIMVGRYPIYCLFVDVPAGEVDFNVHPTKEEVRFRNERGVAGACYHAARTVLETHAHVPELKMGDAPPAPSSAPERPAAPVVPGFFTSPEALVARAFERKRALESQSDWVGLAMQREEYQPRAREFAPALAPSSESMKQESVPMLLRGATNPHSRSNPIAAAVGEQGDAGFWNRPFEPEPLGQIANTYVLARFGEDLLIIDQHAAHERIRFMELLDRPRQLASQSLLVPVTFEVPADRVAAFQALRPALEEMGFDVVEFGMRTWAVNAMPADLASIHCVGVINDLLDDIDESVNAVDRLEGLRQQILIRAACHSAIRAGQHLPEAQMRELLALMRRHQLSFTCPHGRPTISRLSREELDRQFRRIV